MVSQASGRRRWIIGLLVLGIGAAGAWLGLRGALQGTGSLPGAVRVFLGRDRLPEDIIGLNGRIEATEIDVAAKLPGRVAEVLAREGDSVEAGSILARMDTASLEAQLRQVRAELRRAEEEREYARALVTQRESERRYAERELQRLQDLVRRKHVSEDQVDQARTQAETAAAALRAAEIKVVETGAAIEAAAAQMERIQVDIADSALRAPRRGRVLYRLAEPGEVLGAGGKVLTLLDLADVYMVVFLPETAAGRVAIGAEARILLDAAPGGVIPARVSFVAARAQFTPKQVETHTEREKLVFRAKARIDPELLARHEPWVKTGLPGVAYLRLDPDVPWPDWLATGRSPWPDPSAPSPD